MGNGQRKLRLFFIVSLVFILVISALSFTAMRYFISQQEGVAAIVNMSGRQRMLSQRIALLANELIDQEKAGKQADIRQKLESSLAQMETEHNMLVHGISVNLKHYYVSEALQSLYFAEPISLNKQVDEFIEHTKNILANESNPDQAKLSLNHVLEASNEPLLNALNLAVLQYEKDSQNRLMQAKLFTSIGLIVLVCSFIVALIFILRPLMASVSEQVSLINLLKKVALIANESSSVEGALKQAIEEVCKFTGWSIGHAYLYDEEKDSLVPLQHAWYLKYPEQFTTFKEITNNLFIPVGKGLIGEVFSTGEADWRHSVSEDKSYLRHKEALECGVKGGFAFPIMVGGRAVGVMEFYSRLERKPDKPLLRTMKNIGSQLGRVVERVEAERRFILLETVIENSHDGLIITKNGSLLAEDNSPQIVYVNDAVQKISGYSKHELIGKTPRIFQGEKTDKESLKTLRKAMESGKPYSGEMVHYHKNGTPFWASISIVPIADKTGKITHFAAIERDISERKASEKKLKDASRELKESLRIAEAANKAKSDFLANMSHELRTPMNGVIGMNYLLSETKLTKEQKELVNTVTISAETLLTLLNDILDFSKIEAGELELERIPFDPKEHLENTVNLLQPIAKKNNVALVFSADKEIPDFIWGDQARLKQIVTNLLSNALKFTDKGSVTLNLLLQEKGGKPHLYCEVVDTGIGIPKDKQDLIFGKFAQADNSITRKYGGTGLGLAITKELVEMMGGSIKLESEVGKGSVFSFFIPIEEAPPVLDSNVYGGGHDVDIFFNSILAEQAEVLLVEDHPVNQVFAGKLSKCKVLATSFSW